MSVMIGGCTYVEQYAIEHEGELFGPFQGRVQAHTFALERFDPPYTLRALNTPETPATGSVREG